MVRSREGNLCTNLYTTMGNSEVHTVKCMLIKFFKKFLGPRSPNLHKGEFSFDILSAHNSTSLQKSSFSLTAALGKIMSKGHL